MRFGGQPLAWSFDPLEALRRWPTGRRALLLHSGRLDQRWARWSILAPPVGTYRFVATKPIGGAVISGRSQWLGPGESCPVDRFSHQPFADLRTLLEASEGIWIGYLSYDLGRWVERLPAGPVAAQDDRGWPIIELGYCPGYLVHDRATGCWAACGAWGTTAGQPDELMAQLAGDVPVSLVDPVVIPSMQLHRLIDQAAYERTVATVKRYIAAGDVFQVNLAQRLTAQWAVEHTEASDDLRISRALFRQLTEVSPAWYGAYLELTGDRSGEDAAGLSPSSHRAILSTSPELFLQVDGRRVVTRPIKGTRPASVHPNQLRDSQKDVAELNMIVDLMRNDLGRVCDYGSVRVTQAREIESHPTVHHGLATVQGQLHPSKTIVDLLRATLPAGSITGAPKVRAMQIIDELEPVCRGPYCGCIGYLSRDQACLNVAIRTMLADTRAGRVDFSVGGGVVADSQPDAEYQETLDKAAAMLAALGLC